MHISNKDFNRKTMFYGRARRMALMKQASIVLGIVFVILVLILFLSRHIDFHEENTNFEYLKNYFNVRGYACERIDRDGGRCTLNVEETGNYYGFTRYNNGFNYLIKSASYMLEIRHVSDTYNDITFKTNSNAFVGSKNKTYLCTTDNDVFGSLLSCKTQEGDILENSTYISVVENALEEINSIVESSGYKKESLIKNYVWEK